MYKKSVPVLPPRIILKEYRILYFLKYCYRILKYFPRADNYIRNENISLIERVHDHLEYAKKSIATYFNVNLTDTNLRDRVVSRDKLIELWLYKRKKAFEIIKNDGKWPVNVSATITTERNEAYYNTSPKLVASDIFTANENAFFDRSVAVDVRQSDYFTGKEIEAVIKSCPNGKSCGQDGVFYENLKEVFDEHCNAIVTIMNVMLINLRLSSKWKRSVIQRIPKKNFTPEDLSTLRDISLLPVSYKILSKTICKRIAPFFSDTIAFWQRAFLVKRDRQELIFTLKTSIDDFRHMSTMFHLIFIDFVDAFGSVSHDYIFSTLKEFGIPHIYCCLIEDLPISLFIIRGSVRF